MAGKTKQQKAEAAERLQLTEELNKYKKLGIDTEWDDNTPIEELRYMLKEAEKQMTESPAKEDEGAGALENDLVHDDNTPFSPAEKPEKAEEVNTPTVTTHKPEGIESIANDEEVYPQQSRPPQELYAQTRDAIDVFMKGLEQLEKECYHEHKGTHRRIRNLRGMLIIQRKMFK